MRTVNLKRIITIFLFVIIGLTSIVYATGTNIFPESGNVGIGTTTPTRKLDVNGGSIQYIPTNAGNRRFVISTPVGQLGPVGWSNNGNRRDIRFNNKGLQFLVSPNSNGPSELTGITINESGNVGIGTNNPTQKLDVNGSLYLRNNQNRGGAGSSINFGGYKVSNGSAKIKSSLEYVGGINSRLSLKLGSYFAEDKNELTLRNGNVGINKSFPTEALDVNGNIKLSGNIISNGDICIGKCN